MKKTLRLTSVLSATIVMFMLYSCSKSNQITPVQEQATNTTGDGQHVYGVLEAPPEMYEMAPKYSPQLFQKKFGNLSISSGTPVYTLATPAVRDQGQIGSCTGFCGTEAYEILYNYKNGSFPPVLSPAFLYYEERVNILHQRINIDNGAYMINIDQALQQYGVCTEALYVYPSSNKSTAYKTPPTTAAISNALNYKISNYGLINSGDTAAVKNLLRNNVPIMMGFNVYDNTSTYQYFERLNTTSYTYNPLTSSGALIQGVRLLGGHAVPIIGYDDTRKAFLIENSWGTAWGLKGFFYLPYSVFMSTTVVPQGGVYYATI
jgi:hypothetical protein